MPETIPGGLVAAAIADAITAEHEVIEDARRAIRAAEDTIRGAEQRIREATTAPVAPEPAVAATAVPDTIAAPTTEQAAPTVTPEVAPPAAVPADPAVSPAPSIEGLSAGAVAVPPVA